MNWLLVLALSACCGQFGQPCNTPQINVLKVVGGYRISGSQFVGSTNCARLSMSGLPSTTGASGMIVLGDVNCAGGAFNGFVWQHHYFNCTPSAALNVNIIATDQKTLKIAIRPATIPWGPGCGLIGYTACGDEGQIPCPDGGCAAGPPSLHPDIQGGIELCTKNCGHTQGYSPCTPGMDGCPVSGSKTLVAPQRACRTKPQGGNSQYSCYDRSKIANTPDCLCVPNTVNLCRTNTSAPGGLCAPGAFKDC